MRKVLVVDGKATNRELICTVLERSGYTVAEARDGAEALRSARAWRPELIILDLHTPGVDGFAFIQEIRRDQELAATPVMALASNAMPGDGERVLSAGFTVYIAKPVPLPMLRGEVQRLLHLKPSSSHALSS